VIAFFATRQRVPLEPWQRYSWDGWYWLLHFALALAVLVTPLLWLGIVLLRLLTHPVSFFRSVRSFLQWVQSGAPVRMGRYSLY
jgi:hypothetical protein